MNTNNYEKINLLNSKLDEDKIKQIEYETDIKHNKGQLVLELNNIHKIKYTFIQEYYKKIEQNTILSYNTDKIKQLEKNINNILNENFNKLYKNGDKIYEKIGNSQNKNSWNVKEFLNTNLEKEYKESYINNDFKDILVNAVYNIDNNDLITNEFKKDITTKLLK